MKKCPCCNSSKYYPIFNFGSQPWCGDFRSVNSNNKIKKHPLNLIMCKSCRLVRLNYFIPKF